MPIERNTRKLPSIEWQLTPICSSSVVINICYNSHIFLFNKPSQIYQFKNPNLSGQMKLGMVIAGTIT